MAQCPECNNDVGDDFGLITCGHCGASLFIDMDGNAVSGQQQEVPADSYAESDEQQVASSEYSQFESSEQFAEVEPEMTEEPIATEESPFVDQAQAPLEEFEFGESEETPQEENVSDGSTPAENYEGSVVQELNFDGGEPETSEAPAFYAPEPTTADFKDVMDFANSDMSQALDGYLKYHLKISGIDTLDLRNEVKEALTDKRFIWDTDAMVRSIQDGVLEVDQVSAIKAYILVGRLAHLPLQISWIQQPLNRP